MSNSRKYILDEGYYRVDQLAFGEFVKRSSASKKVYVRGNYDRMSKRYSLEHIDDISKESLVKGSVKVWAGFTY